MARTMVQLCGRFIVQLEGQRVESSLPGRQGRLLVAFLALTATARSVAESWSRRCGRASCHATRRMCWRPCSSRCAQRSAAGICRGEASSCSSCLRMRTWTSSGPWPRCTGPSRPARWRTGRGRGARRSKRRSWRSGRSSRTTRRSGSTSGGGHSTVCSCGRSSATRPHAGPRWDRAGRRGADRAPARAVGAPARERLRAADAGARGAGERRRGPHRLRDGPRAAARGARCLPAGPLQEIHRRLLGSTGAG